MTAVVRRRLRLAGRVQGVGFRWFTRSQAQALELSGFVRNERDGSVVCEVQGPPARVDELLTRLRAGPPGARITAVQAEELGVHDGDDGFAIER